jgi:hypothetical protein
VTVEKRGKVIAWNKKKILINAEIFLPIPQDARSNPSLPIHIHP